MKIFIAGSMTISVLDKAVEERLNNIHVKNYTVLVGDANGVDKAVQKYFFSRGYTNVIVFASEGKARNNVGNWKIQKIDVPDYVKGFDYYTVKDKAMSDVADYGFMIWNGETKGTLNNIINLIKSNKKTVVYLTKLNSFYNIDSMEKLQDLIDLCGQSTRLIFDKLHKVPAKILLQTGL
jgi:hypothetical protein